MTSSPRRSTRSGPRRRPAHDPVPPPQAERWPWWRHPALIAALVSFVLYLPGLGGDWLRDDHPLIARHPYLRADGWLLRLLGGDFWAPVLGATGMWRPMVVASYWIDGRISGWTPFWFHAVNVAAHALTSAALVWVLLRTGVRPLAALVAGLWFAAMPAHVESVAWVSGRTDVFCALFGLVALGLDARADRAGRSWPGVLAPLALLGALLSKEAAAPLAGVLAIAEWVRRGERGRSLAASARWLLPYVVVTAAWLIAHRTLVADPGVIEVTDPASRVELRRAAWALLPGYILFLWPWFAHSPDRAAPRLAPSWQMETAIGATVIVAIVALLAWLLRRRSPAATPLALFLLPLVPPLLLASTRGYGLFGERHVYLPSAGAAWLLALSWPWLAGERAPRPGSDTRRWIALGATAALIGGSAVATLQALPDYRSDEHMYRAMTVKEPDNPTGFVGLAGLYASEGRAAEALPLLGIAERMDPGMAMVHVVRSQIASRAGDWHASLAAADRALALAPSLHTARLLRALATLRLGRIDEAGAELARLRASHPADHETAAVWGQYLIAAGRATEALPVLETAAAGLERDPGVWDALGFAYVGAGRFAEARDAFARTVAIQPGYLEGWMRLAGASQRLGDDDGRERALAAAARLPGGAERVALMRRRLEAVGGR